MTTSRFESVSGLEDAHIRILSRICEHLFNESAVFMKAEYAQSYPNNMNQKYYLEWKECEPKKNKDKLKDLAAVPTLSEEEKDKIWKEAAERNKQGVDAKIKEANEHGPVFHIPAASTEPRKYPVDKSLTQKEQSTLYIALEEYVEKPVRDFNTLGNSTTIPFTPKDLSLSDLQEVVNDRIMDVYKERAKRVKEANSLLKLFNMTEVEVDPRFNIQ